MAYDLFSKIDINAEVSSEAVQDAMSRIRGFMLREWPDQDTSPSSPFGNLVLQPLSKCLVLVEQALECVLSDVQLENALNGIVCDCNFIQEFLKGLGVTTLAEANCTGWVRWHFVEDPTLSDGNHVPVKIDRGVNMLFSGNIFHIYAPFNTPINLISSSDTIADNNANYARVFQSSDQWVDKTIYPDPENTDTSIDIRVPNEWYADFPVYGPSTADLSAGTLAEIDEDLPYFGNVRSVELLEDIVPYTIPTDLAGLIKLVRTIQPSANITTRGNATSYTLQKFPKTIGVSPVISGDKEMSTRAAASEGDYTVYMAPYMDIYAKGVSSVPETVSIVLPVTYDDSNKIKIFGNNNVFYPGNELLLIGNLYYADDTTPIKVFDASGNIDFISNYIEFTPNTDSLSYNIKFNDNIYKVSGSGAYLDFEDTSFPGWGTPSEPMYFRLEVKIDRLPASLSAAIQSPDVSPALNVLARPFVVCDVQALNVTYRKDVGKFFDRQQAVSQIYTLINSMTYPTQYSDAYVGDIIMSNGASGVISITGTAKLRDNMVNTPNSTQYANFGDGTMLYNGLNISSLSDVNNVGVKNVQYILPRENINLIELP